MLQYMKHRDHGTHIAYSQDEVERNESHGWVCVDHPHDDPFEVFVTEGERALELKDKTIPELKEIANNLGLKVHPRAKENSIIKKILDAGLWDAE